MTRRWPASHLPISMPNGAATSAIRSISFGWPTTRSSGRDEMPRAHDALFRALADPTRRAIFERLCREGEQTVGALTTPSGVSHPAVSKHLGVLKRARLVRERQDGRQTHYRAQFRALAPLIDWTSQLAGFWESRFDSLEDLLKRMDQ